MSSPVSPEPSDLRARKRFATRRAISAAADRLFRERGFENVTVDEIAAAADVGRMTVFNYFPRKEDMFFDRDEEVRNVVREALRQRTPGTSPIEALSRLPHRLVAEQRPYVDFSANSQGFVETVERSETLKARARAIRDEIAQMVAVALAESAGQSPDDPDAHLAAGLLLATWTVAFIQAHRVFRETQDKKKAKAAFLTIITQGAAALTAALAYTPYVSSQETSQEDWTFGI